MPANLENPHRFMETSKYGVPILLGAAGLLLAWGWGQGLNASPDFRQGEAVRIMFVHVPAAWTCLGAWAFMSMASLAHILFRTALADIAARNAALPGAVFTLICLLTGSLWGKPVWNTWWEWDARMTSVLVLFFLFLGHIAISKIPAEPRKTAQMAAIYCLVGAINLPIIKFSVEWWNTLHQPASILRAQGPAMPPEYLIPLLVSALGYACLFAATSLCLIQAEIISRRAERMMIKRLHQS